MANAIKIVSNDFNHRLESGGEINGHQIEVVEVEDWVDDGKYQYQTTIIRFPEWNPDKFWMYGLTRSGSYFSHYEYERPYELYEAIKKEKITHEWVSV